MASVTPAKKAGKKKSWKHIVARPSVPRLHTIIESGSLESVAKRLGKKPGELNIPDDHGRTPLHIAALLGHVEILNFLIAKRAIIEAVDNNGLTPLHCACSSTNPEALFEVCSLLLTVAQADVTKKTHAGTTPLHYFVRNPCVDPVMYFETLTLLISKGADVNSQNKHGETALHQAAGLGLEQSVMFLLSNSAIQIDTLDKHGETALHCACKAGNRDVVKLLLDYNADCSISGTNGTPQEIAERVGDADILQLITDCLTSKNGERRIASTPARRLQSLTFDPRVLELAEAQGYDTSVVIACLYQLQKRGSPTDNLDLLIQEINKQSHHHQRECSICLCKEIDSLLLPCRHSATCIDCGERVKEQTGCCPICRGKIDDILKIFLS